MPRPRAILLDFYGTVVEDDTEVIALICEEIALAAEVSRREVGDYWSQRFCDLCLASHGPTFRTQRELELASLDDTLTVFRSGLDALELSERLYQYWRRPRPFPEARRMLKSCGLPVVVVSNIDNAELASAIRHGGFSFAGVVTSEDCAAYKPRPEPFRRALEILKLSPCDVLHVGDSWSSDVQGAKALGIPTLWMNRNGRGTPMSGARPDFVASDLSGLLAAVKGASC